MQTINQLKKYHQQSSSIFAIRKVFRELKDTYDSQMANDLIDAIELNDYWSQKGLFVKDSSETLGFLNSIADWVYQQLCVGTIKPKRDNFDQSVFYSKTTELLPDYERNSICADYQPVFSSAKQSMLYVDLENLKSLSFDNGKIVERFAKDKTFFRLSVELKIKTLKVANHGTKHIFEDKALLAFL